MGKRTFTSLVLSLCLTTTTTIFTGCAASQAQSATTSTLETSSEQSGDEGKTSQTDFYFDGLANQKMVMIPLAPGEHTLTLFVEEPKYIEVRPLNGQAHVIHDPNISGYTVVNKHPDESYNPGDTYRYYRIAYDMANNDYVAMPARFNEETGEYEYLYGFGIVISYEEYKELCVEFYGSQPKTLRHQTYRLRRQVTPDD